MWLLETDTYKRMAAADQAGVNIPQETAADFSARMVDSESNRVLTVAGNQAEIRIEGVLTPTPDVFAFVFGGGNTTYQEIISALAEAEADETIDEITLAIASPGGSFTGLFETIDALNQVSKPIKAVVHGIAASAAYAIAAQAGSIEAANRAARVGSIGIVASFRVSDDIVEITSTDAPKKRPNVQTEEGQAVVREELDAMHQLFIDAIAGGRNSTADEINAQYGQGATLLASQALTRGMIDAISGPSLALVSGGNSEIETAQKSAKKPEATTMDLKTLMSTHPEAYAAAVEVGANMERDRVTAHLTMGEASGSLETAIAAVKEGKGMTLTLQSEYMAAGMNNTDISARAGDEPDAGDAGQGGDDGADGGDGESQADIQAKQVLDVVEENLGIGEL